MFHRVIEKLFNRKGKNKECSTDIKKLKDITKSLMESYEPPDHTILETILELNENALIGFDHNNKIIFKNTKADKIIDLYDKKNINMLNIFPDQKEQIESFIKDEYSKKAFLKVEVRQEDGSLKNYDNVIFKITNGKTYYIMFLINCLERMIFNDNCPLKDSCPLGEKCKKSDLSKLELVETGV